MGTNEIKRIAVLVYGVYIEFGMAVRSWKFLNDLNCDVYFSTWNKSKKYSPKLDVTSEYEVTDELLTKFIPNINYIISDEKNYNFNLKIEKIKFHWQNCFDMIQNSNKKYDILMLMRPENYMSNIKSERFLETDQEGKIFGLEKIRIKPNGNYFVQDIFFVGNFEIMKDLLLSFPTETDDMHGNMAKQILSKNLNLEVIENFNVMTLRPNCNELKEEEINYENLWKKVTEWE